jgi:glycosyltransferase involved in cell wall biosynthesis
VQIARFDPAKGILNALDAYEKFHMQLSTLHPEMMIPKLLICGHGSIDDPDGSLVHDAALQHIENAMPHLASRICVMRLGPSDQILNTILSKAWIVLQLSSQEGFEVKVSEALHKGKPVIATRAGGIPLQLDHGRSGYLVDVGDTDAVTRHLLDLWTDHDLYNRMSAYSLVQISDEISTVGNALNWLFLSCKLSQGERVKPHQEWIQDLARRDLGQSYTTADGKLKRFLHPAS